MYFDFEDHRPDTPTISSAVSRREGVLFSFVLHLAGFLAIFLISQMPAAPPDQAEREAARLQLEREREARRFVFMAPRNDVEALKPPVIAEDSDKNRLSQAPEIAKEPTNPLPFARGDSPERVEALKSEAARGSGPESDPARGSEDAQASADEAGANRLPDAASAPDLRATQGNAQRGASGTSTIPGGALGEALRNLQKYVQQDTYGNQGGGGGSFGPSIQFDSKGVEFGPWIRRFVAQIKRNWFIPYAAMSLKGHVAITFNVHKNGALTELTVVGASDVESFNNAAFNALAASNPTVPLPPEYPSDSAFFTVTFYYNETPPGQ